MKKIAEIAAALLQQGWSGQDGPVLFVTEGRHGTVPIRP
jgi:hypothetical protein